MVECAEWDRLVTDVYCRIYNFQQQEGCRNRGTFALNVPEKYPEMDECYPESIPEVVNGDEMGVKFVNWLARSPTEWLGVDVVDESTMEHFHLRLFWERNFYPDVMTLANDLHTKGFLDSGEYVINIDW